jgi:hypothetical protein
MAIIYYPPENLSECQANTIPLTQFSGWAVQFGDPKLDALVQAGFLRSIDLPRIQVSKPGFVDEHFDVLSGKATRADIIKRYNIQVKPAIQQSAPSPVKTTAPQTLSDPALNPYKSTLNNQPVAPAGFGTDSQQSVSDSMDLLEILNKRHSTSEPVELKVEATAVVADEVKAPTVVAGDVTHYKMDTIRSMTDEQVASLSKDHGIDLVSRDTRRKRVSDLVRLGIIEE